MEFKKINNKIIVRIDKGEEIIETLTKICVDNNIRCAQVSGIGATNKVKIGLFETKSKEYHSRELTGDFEIAPLSGNISRKDGKPYLHIHINICDKDYNSFGGHLNSAIVSATFECFIDVIEMEIERKFDEDTGLNLLKF